MSARISILVPDVGSPILGAATALAKHLQQAYQVEIVGPDLGSGVCAMYRDTFPYRVVPAPRLYRLPDFIWESRRLSRALDGDLIIAVKAYANTIPLAWWEKVRRGRRAVAYLDEWDGALFSMLNLRQKCRSALGNLHHPLEDIYYPWIEKLIPRLDTVLSTTTFLQKKFGGHLVHMGVDTDYFSPSAEAEVEALKHELGLGSLKNIVFGGVVRPHKGIELILEALAQLGNARYRLVIVGPKNAHVEHLLAEERYRPYLVALGARPKEEMPRYLSLADAIVLPLSNNLLAQSQMPCKVFEAMSMAKPVIASQVSDLPLVLEGCGRLVPPDDATALARAIDELFSNEAEARQLGLAAREKCIRLYSRDVTRNQLIKLAASLLDA